MPPIKTFQIRETLSQISFFAPIFLTTDAILFSPQMQDLQEELEKAKAEKEIFKRQAESLKERASRPDGPLTSEGTSLLGLVEDFGMANIAAKKQVSKVGWDSGVILPNLFVIRRILLSPSHIVGADWYILCFRQKP